jgi:hypothetical protein
LNLNSSLAKCDFSALSLLGKSMLLFVSNLFTKNLRVAGLGEISVYTFVVEVAVLILM